MPTMDINVYSVFLDRLADAAAKETLPHFRTELDIADKPGKDRFDPVTIADKNAERAIRALIEAHYPDHGILGEEYGEKPGTGDLRWVIDPIDGTQAFVAGLTSWATLIALGDEDGPFMGIADQPYLQERYSGRPEGAFLGNTPIRTRACRKLENAILSTTGPDWFTDQELIKFERVRKQARFTRYGYDCYAYCLLASGHLDLVIEAGLESYDIQALIPIIRGAGGVISTWDGGDPSDGGRIVAAATPALHEAAMALLT